MNPFGALLSVARRPRSAYRVQGTLTRPESPAILPRGRVPLPVGRAGFKPVGGRSGVLGRFDSCLFRQFFNKINATRTGKRSLVGGGRRRIRARGLRAGDAHPVGVVAPLARDGFVAAVGGPVEIERVEFRLVRWTQ